MVLSRKIKLVLAGSFSLTWLIWVGISLLSNSFLHQRSTSNNQSPSSYKQLFPIKKDNLEKASAKEIIASLEHFLSIGLSQEAIILTEKLVNNEPQDIIWKLILAKLYFDSGDLSKSKAINSLLVSEYPKLIQVIELRTLIGFQSGNAPSTIEFLKKKFNSSTQEIRFSVGLLLADSLYRNMQFKDAENVYNLLTKEFPEESKPFLWLAILNQRKRNWSSAQKFLREARLRRTNPRNSDNYIDSLAIEWRLFSLRKNKAR